MNETPDTDRVEEPLAPEDERWVRAVRSAWAPQRLSAAERVAFRRRIDERLETRRRRVSPWFAGSLATAALAGAAAIAVLVVGEPASLPEASPGAEVEREPQWAALEEPEDSSTLGFESAIVSPEDALLALTAAESEIDESLPEEFAAIESLFLGS